MKVYVNIPYIYIQVLQNKECQLMRLKWKKETQSILTLQHKDHYTTYLEGTV
jgi:hypothetical protein